MAGAAWPGRRQRSGHLRRRCGGISEGRRREMILYRGQLHDDKDLPELLRRLEKDCLATLAREPITPELVVNACDSLARDIAQGQFDHLLRPFLEAFSIPRSQLDAALGLFSRESLTQK